MNTILFPEDKQEIIEDIIQIETPGHSCGDPKGYFLVDNLFSELSDEYQRKKARENLGVNIESGDVVVNANWGDIKGDISKQEDLTNLINSKAYYKGGLVKLNVTGGPIYSDDNDTTELNISWEYGNGFQPTSQIVTAKKGQIPVTIKPVSANARNFTIEVADGPVTVQLTYWSGTNAYNEYVTVDDYPTIKYYEAGKSVSTTHSTQFKLTANNNYAFIELPKKRNYKISVDGIIGGFSLFSETDKYYTYRSAQPGLGELNITLV